MRSATAVVLCAGVQVAAAFSAPGATLPLRGGRCAASAAAAHAGGPSVQMVAASDVPVSRRAVLSEAVGTGLVLGAAAPAGAKEAKAKAGAWAKHDGEFTEKELDGFTETKSGLLYKDIDEGTGVVPQPGQKIKAHCEWGHVLCARAPARPRSDAGMCVVPQPGQQITAPLHIGRACRHAVCVCAARALTLACARTPPQTRATCSKRARSLTPPMTGESPFPSPSALARSRPAPACLPLERQGLAWCACVGSQFSCETRDAVAFKLLRDRDRLGSERYPRVTRELDSVCVHAREAGKGRGAGADLMYAGDQGLGRGSVDDEGGR